MKKVLIIIALTLSSMITFSQTKTIDYLVARLDVIVVVPNGEISGVPIFISDLSDSQKITVDEAVIVCQTFIDSLPNKKIKYTTYFSNTNILSIQNFDDVVVSVELKEYAKKHPIEKSKIDNLAIMCTQIINQKK